MWWFVLAIASENLEASNWTDAVKEDFAEELNALTGATRVSEGMWAGPSYPEDKLRALRWLGSQDTYFADGDTNGKLIYYGLIVNASADGEQRVSSFAEGGPAILVVSGAGQSKQQTLTRKDVYTFAERFSLPIFQFRAIQAYEFHSDRDALGRVTVVQVYVDTAPGGRIGVRMMLYEGHRTGSMYVDQRVKDEHIQLYRSAIGWGDLSDPFVSPDGAPPDMGQATFEVRTRYVAAAAGPSTCPAAIEAARAKGISGDGARHIEREGG